MVRAALVLWLAVSTTVGPVWIGQGPGVATALADEASDRRALAALYRATDGERWGRSGNWLEDVPLGEWEGVTTDRTDGSPPCR